jgi:hypothetical protein
VADYVVCILAFCKSGTLPKSLNCKPLTTFCYLSEKLKNEFITDFDEHASGVGSIMAPEYSDEWLIYSDHCWLGAYPDFPRPYYD